MNTKHSKKRILLISKYCRLPSPDNYPARGFSLLRELVKLGYDCTLITASQIPISNTDSTKIIDGVKVIELNILSYKYAKSLRRIIGWLQFECKVLKLYCKKFSKPDIVIASSLSLLSIINGIVIKFKFDSFLVFEVRDVWPMVLIENGGFSRYNPFVYLLKWVEWSGYKYSNAIVATMPNLACHVESVLGYPKDVTCVPMGIPDELISSALNELPDYLTEVFDPTKFTITYAGSLGVDNALDTIFEAARLLKNRTDIRFVIFGNGDLVDVYKNRCSDLNNVIFQPAVPNKYIQSILMMSSILYFAAHRTRILEYGQSLNKIVDYMFSGRPILGSYTGYQTMINEAKCGFIVDAGDADKLVDKIIEISEFSKDELNEIGHRGREWVLNNRRYSQIVKNYINIFPVSCE